MSDDFSEIEQLANAIVRSLSSAERRKLSRALARKIAISQRQRITANIAPDGSPHEKRKEKAPPVQGKGPACFLYPSGVGGKLRRVILKSFTWGNGKMLTGYDVEARAVRSFRFNRITKWLPVPIEHRTGGGVPRKPRLRRRTMFRRLASPAFLKVSTSDAGFTVGFSGVAARIANVHHFGLRDRPSLKAQMMSYPKRELLGATEADKEMLIDDILEHVSNAAR